MNIRCRQRRKFKATTHSNHGLPVADNLLNQTFAPTAPNQVWVTDITYIPTREGWLYLAGVKDVFTCEMVGYAMGERMTQDLVSQALIRAVQHKRPSAGLIHHSDRGSQYCSAVYQKPLSQFGMRPSMSRKGNCYDNAPMESFWGSLKNEWVHHHRYASRDQAIASIREFIEIFYNRQRRHSRLGNLAPVLRNSAKNGAPLDGSVSAIASTPHPRRARSGAEASVSARDASVKLASTETGPGSPDCRAGWPSRGSPPAPPALPR